MFREYFILLLLAHIIGDFYFQSEKIARRKEEQIKYEIKNRLLQLH